MRVRGIADYRRCHRVAARECLLLRCGGSVGDVKTPEGAWSEGALRRRAVRSLPLGLITAAAIFGFSLPSRAPSAPPFGRPACDEMSVAKFVYLRDCSVCHGVDAQGTAYGPSLKGVGRAAVDFYISTGRMPLVANARPAKSPQGVPPPGQRVADPHAQVRRGLPRVLASAERRVGELHCVDRAGRSGRPAGRGASESRRRRAGVPASSARRVTPGRASAVRSINGRRRVCTPRRRPRSPRRCESGPGRCRCSGTRRFLPIRSSDLVGYVRYLDHPENRGGDPLWYLGPVAEGAVAIILGLGALLLCARWIGERG